MPASIGSSTRSKSNELAAEDVEWTPSAQDDSATTATIASFMGDCRAQMTDTVPWKEHVWRLLLPRGRQFAARWRARQPHEQISSGGHKRPTDQYLVRLKKHLLDQVFDCLNGNIIDHLRLEEDEIDPIKRAAIQRRRQSLGVCSEKEQRAKLRADTGQWISNTVKKLEGPRWLQAYEKAYREAAGSGLVGREVVLSNGSPPAFANVDGAGSSPTQIYQGRAYSAKELLAMSDQYKDEVTARAARLIIDSPEAGVEDTSIRYWRRAMEDVWSGVPDTDKERFIAQAAVLSSQVNKGYQQIDKVFQDIVVTARDLQAIDGAFGAVVIETRKWSPTDRNWQAVRYVLTTIPSKSPRKLQASWDFVAYDQKVTDWCDVQRVEVEKSANQQNWQIEAQLESPPVSSVGGSSRQQSTPLFQPSPSPSPRRDMNVITSPISALRPPLSPQPSPSREPSVGSEPFTMALPGPAQGVASTADHDRGLGNSDEVSQANEDHVADAPLRAHASDHGVIHPGPLAQPSGSILNVEDTTQGTLVPVQRPETLPSTVAVPIIGPESPTPVNAGDVCVSHTDQGDAEVRDLDGNIGETSSTSAKKRTRGSDWAREMVELRTRKRQAVAAGVKKSANAITEVRPKRGVTQQADQVANSRPRRGQRAKESTVETVPRLLRTRVSGK